MFSISTSVRLIKAPLPIFFWIVATPATTKLSFIVYHEGEHIMEMKNFNKEFVQRTKEIVTDLCQDDFKYDVTLLLNCLLGLVSLPTERTARGVDIFQTDCVKKLKDMGVVMKSTSDEQTFRTVKNALSHMYIEPCNEGGNIEQIILKDRISRTAPVHTELKFSVENLKEFALYVADKHLKR